ncbi:LacI family DNA-binding transcriptional regulator [Streptomyces sp. JJ36]|uniref:LacI family DNA-binding transcriptional regulator n=1 Tax=Streptomyces sp. JJ36 TaxID=2736645 RepID=UPI001F48E4C6|nr:LacI family DNA-binding transcriptional regulator [Streptomyces sp. JJ36]MCF6525758.1 LacI family DNA-binding transcriptional regulator [Streptomyces sp. JJ36]
MADISDVARQAGVSTATVSRALRGVGRVAEATRHRVLEAAEQLGYSVSPSASRLASGRTGTVAVVVPFVSRWSFGQVIEGVEAVLRTAGFDMLLYNLADAEGRRRMFADNRLRGRVDAVLVLYLPMTQEEKESLSALEVPVAVVGALEPEFFGVRIDDVAAARTAVRHLLHLGHRHIGLLSGVPYDQGMPFTSQVDRRVGYLEALAEADVQADPALEAVAEFSIDGGSKAMTHLLSGRGTLPTAVFAHSDEMAFGAMHALRRSGLEVPGDVSVIGFDGHDLAEVMALSTVIQPLAELGSIACEQVLAALGTDGPAEPVHRVVPTELLLRGSTAPPATTGTGPS